MPNLACRICGRVVYTSSALEGLFAEERRCPRCGGMLYAERRVENRRKRARRQNPSDEPGPPGTPERRRGERRTTGRRPDDASSS
jgi:hypothetical protein